MAFRYATVADVRAEGITVAQLSDSAALKKIEEAAEEINNLTGSFFVPVYERHVVNGRGSPMLHHRLFVPFIELEQLLQIDNLAIGAQAEVISSSVYRVQTRSIHLKSDTQGGNILSGRDRAILRMFLARNEFEEGAGNFRMDGFFGDIQKAPDGVTALKKIETTIGATLAAGDTTITLADTTGIAAGDVLVINKAFTAIVVSVDSATDVTVDASMQGAAIADEVVTFGPVYSGIRRVTMILVNRNRYPLNSNQYNLSRRRAGLVFERTDNYSYRLKDRAGSGLDTDYNSTGDEEADRILNMYTPPPYVGYI